jgi:hypothetical protein
MSRIRFQIRSMMIVVAAAAVIMGLVRFRAQTRPLFDAILLLVLLLAAVIEFFVFCSCFWFPRKRRRNSRANANRPLGPPQPGRSGLGDPVRAAPVRASDRSP